MLAHGCLPNCYWAEAVSAAAYLRNRTPSITFDKHTTPYEKWYGRKPNVKHLRVFGCCAYAHVQNSDRKKLNMKAKKYRFVGYSKKSKVYRLFNEETRQLVTRRDAIFNERDFCCKNTVADTKATDLKETVEVNSSQSEVNDVHPQHSERRRRLPVRFGYEEYADTVSVDHRV